VVLSGCVPTRTASLTREARAESTIDGPVCTGDERSFVTEKKRCDVGDLFRRSNSAEELRINSLRARFGRRLLKVVRHEGASLSNRVKRH
jgi:hypothetical protein